MIDGTAEVFDQRRPPLAHDQAQKNAHGTPDASMERCVSSDSSRQGPQHGSPSPPDLGLPQNENLAEIRPAGLRILRVLCDPESLELTVKEQIRRAQVSENTWYKYTRDREFKRACGDVMREILLEPHLVAIALREAQNGSWKHFEWLSDRTSLAGVDDRGTDAVTIR